MNTSERIVEAYFRHCLDCFTMTDVKVAAGNNRQLDLVALRFKTGESYHVETSVKIAGFCPDLTKLETAFEHKFFGTPKKNEKPTGDHALGKDYRPAVNRAYKRLGLTPSKVQRVYVCWAVKGPNETELAAFCRSFSRRYHLGKNPIQVWSFRDRILPELTAAVGTSNYDDDALRTLSLLGAAERQKGRKY
ncbi:hypothetical protein [Botrimarina hoheduenensis]|uniref:Uncharacterized protein n=1 Tax=Botrimarina hoheduenensis TaxID=2528000 RepID=A0A5C5WCI5_9BACT|nr:hypothetical protein [Botrimarina hoheduenensis]TWT47382.1 hypothetical protein Pla111_09950 [Botrimarina hoheduenensis]